VNGRIDKTLGDEVMIVLPSFGEDVELAGIGLAVPDPWAITPSVLVADLLGRVHERVPGRTFSAGFALGPVVLDAVGADGYEEWTVYGNVVNAAKRLQEVAAKTIADRKRNSIAVSVIEKELGQWFVREFDLDIWRQIGPITLVDPTSVVRVSKGVGKIRYVVSEVTLR